MFDFASVFTRHRQREKDVKSRLAAALRLMAEGRDPGADVIDGLLADLDWQPDQLQAALKQYAGRLADRKTYDAGLAAGGKLEEVQGRIIELDQKYQRDQEALLSKALQARAPLQQQAAALEQQVRDGTAAGQRLIETAPEPDTETAAEAAELTRQRDAALASAGKHGHEAGKASREAQELHSRSRGTWTAGRQLGEREVRPLLDQAAQLSEEADRQAAEAKAAQKEADALAARLDGLAEKALQP